VPLKEQLCALHILIGVNSFVNSPYISFVLSSFLTVDELASTQAHPRQASDFSCHRHGMSCAFIGVHRMNELLLHYCIPPNLVLSRERQAFGAFVDVSNND
jgi:hypothetical protein